MTSILNSDPVSDAVQVKSKKFVFVLAAANKPTPITDDSALWYKELWLYSFKALDNGKGVDNGADVYAGQKSVLLLKSGDGSQYADMVQVATTGDIAARATYYWNGTNYVQWTDATHTIIYNTTTSKWNLKHNTDILATADTLTGAWANNTGVGTAPAPTVVETFPTPDLVAVGGSPVVYRLPFNQRMQVKDIVIQGAIGDGVFCKFN